MASLEDIALLLGRTLEGVEQLRDDFNEERNALNAFQKARGLTVSGI